MVVVLGFRIKTTHAQREHTWEGVRKWQEGGRIMVVLTSSFFVFLRKYQIYYKDSSEIQSTLNIIKITLKYMDNWRTIAAAGTSRRRAAVAVPLPEPTWHCRWQPENLCARAPKDRRSGVTVIAIESLNRSEELDTKSPRCVCTTRKI